MYRVTATCHWRRYAYAFLLVGIGVLVRYWLWPHDAGHPFLTFYVPVTLVALWLGLGSGLFATLLAAFSAHLFAAPDHFLTIDVEDAKSIGMFVLNGTLVSLLVAPIRHGVVTVVRLPSMPLENGAGPGIAARSKAGARVPAGENLRC